MYSAHRYTTAGARCCNAESHILFIFSYCVTVLAPRAAPQVNQLTGKTAADGLSALPLAAKCATSAYAYSKAATLKYFSKSL